MNTTLFKSVTLALCLSVVFSACSSKRSTQRWFSTGEWYNGMKLMPHETLDRQVFAAQYAKHKDWWDAAFKFLKDTDLGSLAPGRYPIMGNDVYANVTVGPMKPIEKAKWETHKRVTDLQYNFSGAEKMGVEDLSRARVTVPYDERKDVTNYEASGKYYLADPNTFFLFFPNQVHRPSIKTNDSTNVRKIVLKIRYTD